MKDYLNYTGDLRKLSKKDLEWLFIKLLNYQMRYRKNLGISPNMSFGLEIEFSHVKLKDVAATFTQDANLPFWCVHEDKSCEELIDGEVLGGEVSTDIMHDLPLDWDKLSKAIALLKKLKAKTNHQTGLHVHVGSQIFKEDIENVCRFVKIWCVFEHVIFKFGYGNTRFPRPNILFFAQPIATATKLKCKYDANYFKKIRVPQALNYDKKWAVNFSNYQALCQEEEPNNTIEIRCANGTLNKSLIQNTVNFYLKLMEYVVSPNYDEDLINHLFNQLKLKDLDEYSKLYIDDALLLADLIFNNPKDKINFLKQYVKKDEIVFIR